MAARNPPSVPRPEPPALVDSAAPRRPLRSASLRLASRLLLLLATPQPLPPSRRSRRFLVQQPRLRSPRADCLEPALPVPSGAPPQPSRRHLEVRNEHAEMKLFVQDINLCLFSIFATSANLEHIRFHPGSAQQLALWPVDAAGLWSRQARNDGLRPDGRCPAH